jgi:NAD(P)H-hydrate epimerase
MSRAETLSARTVRGWLPRRAENSHKGDYGHVLIAAGSRGMSGAAILSGWGALRGGAGLVTAAVPESQQPMVAAKSAPRP